MKKIIFINMLFLSLAGIVVTALLLAIMFYNFFGNQVKNEVRQEVQYLAKSLETERDSVDYLNSLRLSPGDSRVTLVAADGEVLFDSHSDPAVMENHADRPEIMRAARGGQGEDKRFSETLNQETFYRAVKLDGGAVLRVAKTTDSIFRAFLPLVIPIFAGVLLVVLLAYIASRRLTKRIVEPINNLDPANEDDYPYDELSPFLRTISRQKARITEQMDELEGRTNTIRTIIEDMREGLILLDRNGMILTSNAGAMGLFNATAQKYENRNILELTRQYEFLEKTKAALNGEAGDVILKFAPRTIQVFFDPVFRNNSITGAILLFLDITEKADAEKLRREFTANVSHELKTPLTVISGLSEMIVLGMAKEEDTIEFANKIKTEAGRMISLVNDILKLSELDENPAPGNFGEFNLYELAEQAILGLSSFSSEKNISVELSGGGFEIKANKNMIAELLNNLIENAIKYNVENGRVSVAMSKTENEVRIEVSDTGIGVAEEHIPRIFERFYRVDKSRSKKTGGTGLGLSIVKHIVRYHNGYVDIESSPGKGTKITAVLKSND